MPVEGVGIADVGVFVVMLFIVGCLWILLSVRGPVGRLPIVGGSGVNLIDGMRTTLTAWANSIESFLTYQQSQASQLWASFVNNIMTPALNAIDADMITRVHLFQTLATSQVMTVQANLQAEIAFVRTQAAAAINGMEHQLVADEAFVKTVVLAELDQLVRDVRATEQLLNSTRAELDQARQLLQTTMAALSTLVVFLPLLQSLAAFESTAVGGVSALEREVGLTQQQLQGIRDQLAKLLALGAITALGAVAIENIIRVARDPCSACGGVNQIDLATRLGLVEVFGET